MNKYILLQICRREERLNLAIIVYNLSETRVVITNKWDRLKLFLENDITFFKKYAERLINSPPSYKYLEKKNWNMNVIQRGVKGTSLLPLDALIEELEDMYL